MVGTRIPWELLLFIELIIMIFLVGLLPQEWHSRAYSTLYTILLFTSVLNLDKYRKTMFGLATVAFVMEWVSTQLDFPILRAVSIILNVLFFTIVVGFLISQIYKAQYVDGKVILGAISGYLLLGLVFTLLLTVTALIEPGSFNFSSPGKFMMSDAIYYGFVTLSTLGYGDLLPITPFSKSLALLNTITGQLYLAIIIALLVGKYSSTSGKESNQENRN